MIAFNIGSRRFSPSWFPTLLVLLVVPAMCALANWQYNRAQQKIDLQTQVEQRINRPAAAFSDVKDEIESNRYQSVEMTGTYDAKHQILLDNQPREWQRGYAIITPFSIKSGEIALVNRGWVAQPPSRDKLPDLTIQQPQQSITGKINLPGKAFGLGEMTRETGWPLRVQYLDYAAIEKALGKPVLPMVLMLNADEPDGYDRTWQPASVGPMKHYGYMFQWLAMAVAVLVLFVTLNLKKRSDNDEASE